MRFSTFSTLQEYFDDISDQYRSLGQLERQRWFDAHCEWPSGKYCWRSEHEKRTVNPQLSNFPRKTRSETYVNPQTGAVQSSRYKNSSFTLTNTFFKSKIN